MKYNHQQIGKKWQRVWEQKGAWKVSIRKARKPYYNLMMFPYPSAEGLHVGNVYAFTGSDIHGRFRRMQGFDVFEPMGFDSFGIHSENFAIKKGTHPKSQTAKNIKNFRRQLKQMGALFDWSREVVTSEPNYYKWTQWLFLQLFKAGLAYRAKAPVDWCSSCKTVLADEQVIDGKCERCVTEVIQKELEQWFFRITKYADRLLKNLERIDWSERTKIAQRNWIGEKEGINITYEIEGSGEKVVCFTTRPDTNFGATFIVIGPEHPLVEKITTAENREQVRTYVERTKKLTEEQRIAQGRAKTGVFTGSYAVNSLNGKKLPIWVSDFVLGNVGTGAVVGVPGHDMRDFEFAKTFGLPIIRVVVGTDGDTSPITQAGQVQEETGSMINSDFLNGLDIHGATKRIMAYLEEKGWGKRVISYHLRDWLISRQRYWGPPIPIIYCEKCGMVPVPEKDLPVLLPNVKDFRPTGTDKSPLASVEKFVKTKCPKCKSPARRETDVLDTFLDSAWYYLRYPSVGMQNAKIKIQNDNAKSKIIELPWNTPITKRWLPVNMYIGGQEHAVLHLLYTRFVTMALKDAGLIGFEEPFKKFRAHGLLIKEGKKMSKSKGNVVNPDEILKKYGADTLRIYLMFLGPFSEGGDWSDKGIVGIYRFLNRVWALAQDCLKRSFKQEEASLQTPSLEWLRQRTIRKVTEDLESLHYNTAIAALMEYANSFQQSNPSTTLGASIPTIQQVKTLLILLAPFAPYITEELWQKFGHEDSVHNQRWPKYDPKLIQEEKIKLILQVNGKVRYVAEVPSGITENEAGKLALENEKIKKWLAGKEPKKIIFVPDKLVNVVVS